MLSSGNPQGKRQAQYNCTCINEWFLTWSALKSYCQRTHGENFKHLTSSTWTEQKKKSRNRTHNVQSLVIHSASPVKAQRCLTSVEMRCCSCCCFQPGNGLLWRELIPTPDEKARIELRIWCGSSLLLIFWCLKQRRQMARFCLLVSVIEPIDWCLLHNIRDSWLAICCSVSLLTSVSSVSCTTYT